MNNNYLPGGYPNPDPHYISSEEEEAREAVAILARAAPELLAAVECLDTTLRGMDPYGLYANGRGQEFAALIAKAKGQA